MNINGNNTQNASRLARNSRQDKSQGKRKTFYVLTTILFWALIIAVAFFVYRPIDDVSGNGYSDHGNGTGAGTHGDGTGAGKGKGVSHTGKGTGDGESAAPNVNNAPKVKETPPPVQPKTPGKSTKAADGTEKEPSQKKADVPPEKPLPKRMEKFGGEPKKADPPVVASGGSESGFFGVEVSEHQNVLFLLDVSGSMDSSTSEGFSRLELMKRELVKVIDEMHQKAKARKEKEERERAKQMANKKKRKQGFDNPKKDGEEGCFCLVQFSTYTQKANRMYKFSDENDVNEAKQYAQLMTSCGGTNIMGAWKDIDEIIKENGIDVVYFLTDGESGDCSDDQLLSYLKMTYKSLQINTFSMGRKSPLLEKLAPQHHGEYMEIR